mgnify:CR=1 FL=1
MPLFPTIPPPPATRHSSEFPSANSFFDSPTDPPTNPFDNDSFFNSSFPFGHGSFGTTSLSATTTVPTTGILAQQRKTLEELDAFFREDGNNPQSPLRGFSLAYANTIQSHLYQLDTQSFDDPEVLNYFAIDFANRFRHNLELLHQAQASGEVSRADDHWKYAWAKGKQLDALLFVPEFVALSGQIILGQIAHIDYDLKPALTEALNHKTLRDGAASRDPRSIEEDLLTAGDHFDFTADRTAREMGIPWVIAALGGAISNVSGHRLQRFNEWLVEAA